MDYSNIGAVMPRSGAVNPAQVTGYATRADQVKKEFAAIFYKELLRQTFESQAAAFSEETNNLMTNTINQDILIDKLAEELARKNMNLLE